MHLLSPFFYMEVKFWTLREDKNRFTSVEMKFFRRTIDYALFDHKRDQEILEKLKEGPVDWKLSRCKSNWLRHVARMSSNRMLNIMLNYRPNGRRRLARPLKILLDDARTGLFSPNWWWMMMMMVMTIVYGVFVICLHTVYSDSVVVVRKYSLAFHLMAMSN